MVALRRPRRHGPGGDHLPQRQKSPIIESGELDMDKLGFGVRGYMDFGVNGQETRAAVQNNGV